MHLALIGNYGASNIGDDAILRAILRSHPDHEFTVLSASPHKTHEELGVKTAPLFPLGIRSFFRHGFRSSFKALRRVSAVVFGGGGLMQDDHWLACFLWAWQIFWVKICKKPYFIYGTGVGPLRHWYGKWLTRWVYKGAVGITVRDENSLHCLKKLGLPEDNIALAADPAFLFHPAESEISRKPHTYLISLRPWLKYNASVLSVFTRYLEKLKKEKAAEFIFVCMQSVKEHDRLMLDPILKKTGGALFVPRHFADLLERMRQAEFAIGMRYHFLIAAQLTQTPALAISYSHKTDSLFKDSQLEPYHLPISELSPENLEKKMTRLSADYNNVRIYQKRQSDKQRAAARLSAEYFEDYIKTLTSKGETVNIHEQK